MADTYDAQVTINISSSEYTYDKFASFQDALSGQGAAGGIQDVSTTVEALDIGDVASTDQGLLFMKNLDPTNYLTYGSTLLEFKLDAGEFAFLRINPGSSVYCKANDSPVKLERHLSAK